MDILISRKTGQIIYNVKRRAYPNRRGYWFGASVEYQGHTADGQRVSIPARDRSKWIDGYFVGQVLDDSDKVISVQQLHKSTVSVAFKNKGNLILEGRVVPLPLPA
jgi:hypothetical protein